MMTKTVDIESALRDDFFKMFPKDAAHTLDSFSADVVLKYLKNLPLENARKIFFRLNSDTATELLLKIDNSLFVSFFEKINTHVGARLLSRLEKKTIDDRLELLPNIVAREIREFLTYKEGSAGYLMETKIIAFQPDNVVEDVLRRLRRLGNRNITVVYIVDEEEKLLGKIPIHYFAISSPEERLEKLVVPVQGIDAMASREELLLAFDEKGILQVPVVDIHNHLLGVIRNDTLIYSSKKEITEDFQAMFGAGREEKALSKVSFAVKKRLPWLQVNLATAFLASMVVGLFEDTIAQITILAIFLPVVAGQSGNTGSQALAVTIRGLALKEIRISQWFIVARKEILVGLINGIAVAITTGTIVYFWSSSLGIAIVIGISMILSMLIAGFAGAIIPIGLKAIGQDPATSSSIILTTVTDICGFLSFLGLASALSSALGIV